MSEDEKEAESERVMDILDRGADMSDEDFKLNQYGLANEIMATFKARGGNINEQMMAPGRFNTQSGNINRLLIRPELISFLEEQLKTAQK